MFGYYGVGSVIDDKDVPALKALIQRLVDRNMAIEKSVLTDRIFDFADFKCTSIDVYQACVELVRNGVLIDLQVVGLDSNNRKHFYYVAKTTTSMVRNQQNIDDWNLDSLPTQENTNE